MLFRFPSRQIKDRVLNNYEQNGMSAAAAIMRENRDGYDHQLVVDNNVDEEEGEQHELGLQEPELELQEEKVLTWTQEMDEILIGNYMSFESLGAKSCFELLSGLVKGTTARECYNRGKELKLKKLSEEECRSRSLKLISEANHHLKDKKASYSL